MTGWQLFSTFYGVAALVSFYPVAKAMLKKFNLQEAAFSFKDSPHFSEEEIIKLEQHYSRLQGALVFWKNCAAKYGFLHHYCIFWVIVGGISTPTLIQSIDSGDSPVKWAVTGISIHVALLSAVHKGFKVEQNYKNFRLG